MASVTQVLNPGSPTATATGPVVLASGSNRFTLSAEITSAPSSLSPVSSGVVSATSSNSSSSSRPPQVYTVKAGSGGFKFEPQELKDVNVGDTVTFEFYPPDHSVARAEFGSACVPYEYTGPNKTGFWSGIELVKDVNHVRIH